MLRALGEAGADLDSPMQGGFTPAMVASCNGHVEALLVLHIFKVDLGAATPDGSTCAFIAAENDHPDVIKCLGRLGASLDTPNLKGATPMFIAAQKVMRWERGVGGRGGGGGKIITI